MTLPTLSEFELIKKFKMRTKISKSRVYKGIGDDTAVLRTKNKNIYQLFTTDMLIEGEHFTLSETSAFRIGRKAMAVNISDIAAMGGLPTCAVVAVGLPAKLAGSFALSLYKGMEALAEKFGGSIVGGDTNRSEKLIVSVALLGEVSRRSLVLRSGAKPGDLLFVTGRLGGSLVSKRHLTFIPKVKEAQFLTQNFKIHAMMDISDGLASDLRRLTEASGVGAVIDARKIPKSQNVKGVREALTDGEDFELLFALSAKEARRLKGNFYQIGQIKKKSAGLKFIDEKGRAKPLTFFGYDHFS